MAETKYALYRSDGQPICNYDGIIDVTIDEKAEVLTEPIEGGQLAAFNKAQQPTRINVTLAVEGNEERQHKAFQDLQRLKAQTGNGSLCSLIAPTGSYSNLALETVSYSRSASEHATLLVLSVSFLEIRTAITTGASVKWSPKSASSSDNVDKGRVQAKENPSWLSNK